MRIALLTSSRADFGIYLPLVQKLQKHDQIDLEVIAFGSHLSANHGNTIDEVLKYVPQTKQLDTPLTGDGPADILGVCADVTQQFSALWKTMHVDLIIALGDRYEMFYAASTAVPFNIPVAHIHGGEVTWGAIDNKYRHCLTMISSLHFACTEPYRQNIERMLGTNEGVFNVGALSIDNLMELELLSTEELKEKFQFDLSIPSILITVHPETEQYQENQRYADELFKALMALTDYQLIITATNMDTAAEVYHKMFERLEQEREGVVLRKSLGRIGYLSSMKHCAFMLGNTSSGYIEASFFSKPVINLGDRQKGRLLTDNILPARFETNEIVDRVKEIESRERDTVDQPYGAGDTASQIIRIIEHEFINGAND